ncbi:hypothetical protein NDU88_006521 [Pleurodeles waltl]|uniref:Uncharacterized protein n=1 Tax=Pleurodeles waltl TaxID=8319 RepID=A0AAV7X1S9_PLEWA|nr:hypothetical protein NDU88_006521 [Pleurodeles waltl]
MPPDGNCTTSLDILSAQEASALPLPATPDTVGVKLNNILVAISNTRTDLGERVDALAVGMGILREDHGKLSDRISQVESSMQALHPSTKELTSQVEEFTCIVRLLEGRVEVAEGRSRWNKLCTVGFLE